MYIGKKSVPLEKSRPFRYDFVELLLKGSYELF